MRFLTTVLILTLMSACTAMMVGGGDAANYPPADDCPDGQTRTDEGCEE